MSYGAYKGQILDAGIQWIKEIIGSKIPRTQTVQSENDIYRNQPKASELPIVPPYKPTHLMSGSIAVPVELEADFQRHVQAVAAIPKPDYGAFQGDDPHSIWANMGPKTPTHE